MQPGKKHKKRIKAHEKACMRKESVKKYITVLN